MNYLKDNEIVIYTVIFGNYDDLKDPPEELLKQYDFICFTDNKNLKSDKYKFIYFDKENNLSNGKMSRKPKILSHLFLPKNYKYSLYIDASVQLNNFDIDDLINKYLVNSNLAVFKHPERNCIYDESKICIKLNKDSEKTISDQTNFYRKSNYPENYGLVAGGFILRKNGENDVIEFEKKWWNEVLKNSVRDQLSFNYVAWKNNFKFSLIKKNLWDNEYFKVEKHKNMEKKKTHLFNERINDFGWKYHKYYFEYEEIFQDIEWPWSGHKFFAYDLVSNIKPKKIVELGTHYGTSLWSFSQAVKDNNLETEINAVDTWKGEDHAGFYDEEVFETVNKIKNEFYSNLNINLIRKTFDDALEDFEDESIDLLNIDGLHTYEAVKNDFENWLPKLKKNGIILFHDIIVTEMNQKDFGVYKLWNELKSDYKFLEFYHSYGLGVLFKGNDFGLLKMKDDLLRDYSFKNKKINSLYLKQNKDSNKTLNLKVKNLWGKLSIQENEFKKIKIELIKSQKLKSSKSFRLGELFFRSIKNPYKLVTFPVNFLRILLEK